MKNSNIITIICVGFPSLICFLTIVFAIYNFNHSGGNHSLLFGTWLEKILIQNKLLIPFIIVLPMFIPSLIKTSKLNLMFIVLGIAECVILIFLLRYLLD